MQLDGRLLTTADWGYAKPRELLCLFASSPPLTREQIGLALWPELSAGQLRNALHSALRQLRRTLGGPGWVGFADGRYALDEVRPLDCDLREFEQGLAEARAARPPAAALSHLRRALAAYGGDFLAGSTPGEWASARRTELRRAYESALGAAGRLLVAEGRLREAADVYQRAIAHEPLDEAAHRALMECWAAAGAVVLSNTIIGGNTTDGGASPDCAGALADGTGGHNLIGDTGTGCTGLTNGVNGDQLNVAPDLEPLASNGGPTNTAAAEATSPAIGAGNATTCEQAPVNDKDQRGHRRNAPSRGVCDIGAYDTGG